MVFSNGSATAAGLSWLTPCYTFMIQSTAKALSTMHERRISQGSDFISHMDELHAGDRDIDNIALTERAAQSISILGESLNTVAKYGSCISLAMWSFSKTPTGLDAAYNLNIKMTMTQVLAGACIVPSAGMHFWNRSRFISATEKND